MQTLVAAGHSGRQWNAMGGYTKVGNHPPRDADVDGEERHWTGGFTVPSMEMRRLLRDAQARFPRESFIVEGSLLPGCVGDELWRARASAVRFRLVRSGADGTLRCYESDGGACSGRTRSVLLAPPSGHWLSRLLRSLLLQQPNPIVHEDAGPHRRVHCFGP